MRNLQDLFTQIRHYQPTEVINALVNGCFLDIETISPLFLGGEFENLLPEIERRNLGAHYTSEGNILKVIKPLFLDALWAEFHQIKGNKNKLSEFHKKISKLKFLDPACGCGNFLIIAYRELRLLEMEVLEVIQKGQQVLDVRNLILVDVDQLYGIEYEEFPARIAEVAMYLVDHQMNMLIQKRFGCYFARLPLNKAATIVHGNALQIAWESIVPRSELSYIMGNPPFLGSRIMNATQKQDLLRVLGYSKDAGELDYVTTWYVKAANYIQGTTIKVAFVSTNSITQGLQVGILWGQLQNIYNIKIHFAHRSFKWTNEGRGIAAVHCVIIGFANFDTDNKSIFDYEDIKGEAHEIKVKNINPYLVDAKDILIGKRGTPICNVPKIVFGSMPNDGGHLLFSDEEKEKFILKEPQAEKYMKPLISAYEFINGEKRWCLWLKDVTPDQLKKLPETTQRIKLVQQHREISIREATQKLAKFPALFGEIREQKGHFIVIPSVSSENRAYIPMLYLTNGYIVNNSCLFVNEANLYIFGILNSIIHMAWVKSVCGRLKSDFRYSNEIVYNNFPFPENPDAKQVKAIEKAAQKVLDVRLSFPTSSLADLYNPLFMPPALVKAHNALDKAVDLAYRPQPFTSEANRMVFLFELYSNYTAGLFLKEKVKKSRKS